MDQKKDFFDKLNELIKETSSLKKFLTPINKAGYPFILIFFLITLILFSFSDFLGWIGFILSLWCIYVFRDPHRFPPDNPNIYVSPADGKILNVKESSSPDILGDDKSKKMMKISIFMNVFNVHVNRIPIAGKVSWLKYIPGTFFNASLDKASENNERMVIKIETIKKIDVYLVQIAGLIARRIKCDLKENQKVNLGERFGIIRFGSRVDLYLPMNSNIKVIEGQTVIAGETILAETVSTTIKKK